VQSSGIAKGTSTGVSDGFGAASEGEGDPVGSEVTMPEHPLRIATIVTVIPIPTHARVRMKSPFNAENLSLSFPVKSRGS
jgi:hypothetical protein